MRTIPLTQGQVTVVDDADFEELSKHRWRANRNGRTFYAIRAVSTGLKRPRQKIIKMHALLLCTPPGMKTDHKDGDGLNNQRENLRVVTCAQNAYNHTKKQVGCSSRFRGVHRSKRGGWVATLKPLYLGTFACEYAAAQAYDTAGIARDAEHFTPNFPTITIEIDRCP